MSIRQNLDVECWIESKGQSKWKEKSIIILVYTIFVYICKKIVMKNERPKCGCGNTQNAEGYCDDSHLNA